MENDPHSDSPKLIVCLSLLISFCLPTKVFSQSANPRLIKCSSGKQQYCVAINLDVPVGKVIEFTNNNNTWVGTGNVHKVVKKYTVIILRESTQKITKRHKIKYSPMEWGSSFQ